MILLILILFFGVQLLLCFKGNETTKYIPIYVLLVCFLLCILLYVGVFGKWGSEEPANQILAIFFFIITLTGCLADAAAWIVHKLYLKITHRYI
ncbi:MAG: hypothetical protein LIO44_05605 [Eubacterium sp.]|nr:hypothetical protein [Eubacterium sp.]